MSVLLDTNVVSELIRKSPDPAVEAWAAGHALEDLFFSAVGEAELRYGAAILPTGRRRETLVSDIERMLPVHRSTSTICDVVLTLASVWRPPRIHCSCSVL